MNKLSPSFNRKNIIKWKRPSTSTGRKTDNVSS